MKTNKTTFIIAAVTLIAGLFAGWLLFGGPGSKAGHEHEQVSAENAETEWTCSMHPQIRQNEPGNCPLCGMDLIPVEEGGQQDTDPLSISMSPTAMQLANVSTTVVGTSDVVKTVRLNGRVQPDERLVVSQSSHIPGRIEELEVNFTGEFVKKGQPIATVYSPQLATAQEELFEAARIKESQPQLFNAAREKLKNWKLSEQQINNILEAGSPSETFNINADVSGYVTGKSVNQGDYIERGQAIYEIADLSRVWVMFDVYEQDISWVKTGDEVEFSVQSLPGQTFSGKISWMSPVIDPQTRVAKAWVIISNNGLTLKPGMFATGTVKSGLKASGDGLVVPKTAVMWTGTRSLVYVKNQNETGISFSMREVTLGPSLGDSYLVESGLDEGEEIAVSGTFSIDAAAQLSGKPSMMMRPESKTMEVPQQFREQLTGVAEAYFELKNELVNDNPEEAAKAAEKVTGALAHTDMSLLAENAHDHWMMLLDPLKEASAGIAAADDLEKQREHFNSLSQHVIEMTESFGLQIDKVYRQHCPMAFNDQGADWLSESEEIRNPYFGDMMLTCGEVTEVYRQGQKVYSKEDAEQAPAAAGHNH